MPGKTSKIKLDGAFAKGGQASKRSRLLPGGWWLWCLVGLGLGLGVWIGGRRYLHNELSLRLSSAESGQEALASIDALMQLDGDAAIDVSRALAHPDFIVAHAAFRALNEQLDAWSQLEAAERTSRLEQLVSQLERVPQQCDQDHRILVTGLASRLYAEALSSRDSIAGQLLDRCKRIMDRRAPASNAPSLPSIESSLAGNQGLAASEGPLSDGGAAGSVPAPLPSIESASSPTTADIRSNGIATDQAKASSQPTQTLSLSEMPRLSSNNAGREKEDQTGSRSDAARVHLTGASSRQATLVERPAAITLSDSDRDLRFEEISSEDSHDQKLRAARPFDASGRDDQARQSVEATKDSLAVAVDQESAEESRAAEETLAGIDNLPIEHLVRLLSSLQPRVSQAAALALRRKGLSDDKLDLAMQLAVGSSAERMNILASLGQRSDLDPRPWLLWMAADGDGPVREQAVGMLAPLLDQEVRRQLRLLLNKERDERVAQTIRRVLVQ